MKNLVKAISDGFVRRGITGGNYAAEKDRFTVLQLAEIAANAIVDSYTNSVVDYYVEKWERLGKPTSNPMEDFLQQSKTITPEQLRGGRISSEPTPDVSYELAVPDNVNVPVFSAIMFKNNKFKEWRKC